MSEHKQKITLPSFICPAISVVIPMYNAEKYIGECLDSLLAQTFKNFEVIVVDDCSTDSSCAIVESYAEKFGERLMSVHMKKKSLGGGYIPRNKGVELARGKYIFFLDSDDAVTETALEELYSLAENFDADIVQCEKYYMVFDEFWNNAEYRKQLKPYNYLTREKIFVSKPLLWENNFEERIKFFSQGKLIWNVWVKLIRRDFILSNELTMPDAVAQDMTFTICALCSAKRYLIVPNVVNYYRLRQNSISTEKLDVPKLIHKWLRTIKGGINFIDKFLSDIEFFSRRPDLKYMLFNVFTQEMLSHLDGVYAQIPAHALDELLRKELDDDTVFTPFIFSTMNIFRLQFIQAQQRIAQLENEIKNIKG